MTLQGCNQSGTAELASNSILTFQELERMLLLVIFIQQWFFLLLSIAQVQPRALLCASA